MAPLRSPLDLRHLSADQGARSQRPCRRPEATDHRRITGKRPSITGVSAEETPDIAARTPLRSRYAGTAVRPFPGAFGRLRQRVETAHWPGRR